MPVGDPASGQVALGPIIDERQRDKVHGLVTGSVEAGATAGRRRHVRGPVLPADRAGRRRARDARLRERGVRPGRPGLRFTTADEVAKLAADSEYGLSLGILTKDVMRGLELARQIPTGIVHINDQTVDDAPNTPFGGIRASGTGARFGGTANLDAFTDTRWVTIRGDIAPYPF